MLSTIKILPICAFLFIRTTEICNEFDVVSLQERLNTTTL
jgi:hypothetical protein